MSACLAAAAAAFGFLPSSLPLVSTEPNDFKIDYGAGEGEGEGEGESHRRRRDDGRFAPDDDDDGSGGGSDDEIRKFRALIDVASPPSVWRSYFPASSSACFSSLVAE